MDKTNFLSDCLPLENIDKETLYQLLVQKRKVCSKCSGVSNPSKIMNGIFDTNAIGPWSKLKGDLNAKVFVVGQDWGNEDSYIDQEGKCSPENFTNKRLIELLNVAGVNDSTPMFFTNGILCMKKTKGLGGSVNSAWFRNCFPFLLDQLKIVKPEILITLGAMAFEALKPLLPDKHISFNEAVNTQEPLLLKIGEEIIEYFPVYHCGKSSFRNRSNQAQINDWKRIKDYLVKL